MTAGFTWVRLRVKDVDETRGIVTVRGGKGDKDRTTVLPEVLRGEVAERKKELRELFEKDRAAGLAGTWLPEALARRYPHGGEKWPWHVKTTEIYTHVAKGVGAMGVRSPLDRLGSVGLSG